MEGSALAGLGPHSSGAEHFLGKEEVPGSNPGVGSRLKQPAMVVGIARFVVANL